MTGSSEVGTPTESSRAAAPPAPSDGNGTPAGGRATPRRVALFSADAWTPLLVPLFRSLWIASSIALIGTWAREAGGPWLMKLLAEGRHDQPILVARVLVASNLPICLFSILAGAMADLLDRRWLLIATQVWMTLVTITLALLTLANLISPWGLLGLTFLLGVGTAAAGPALQAVLPELVPTRDIGLAIGLNSVALNVARAVGPALFMSVVYFIPGRRGIGTSFFLTAFSFTAMIWVLLRWKRPAERAAVHGEQVWGALRSGLQYTIHSPANRAILLRVLLFIVPAVVMWAQVPIIATGQLHMGERGYAVLFAFLGVGAICGVFLMPDLQRRFKIDPVVNTCIALFALGLIAMSRTHRPWIADLLMMFLGVNWVIIPTNFNTATQTSVPAWVKGRAISMYLTVLFGSFALGGAIWGPVTVATSISTSLLIGGLVMASTLAIVWRFPLTLNEGLDLSPAFKGKAPGSAADVPAMADAPICVSVDYAIDSNRTGEFISTMRALRQQRRRIGAWDWRLEPVPAQATGGSGGIAYRERYCFSSPAEFARHPARMTQADLQLLERVRGFHVVETPPSERLAPHPRSAGRFDAEVLKQCAFDCIDRCLEECEIACERLSRDRKGANVKDRRR